MRKKKHEIFLSIITIGTVIATAVGVTFAYFAANLSGNAGKIVSSTANVGTITFEGGSAFTTSSEIVPGWSESKTFTITAAPSAVKQTVYVKMTYKNNMPDLKCNVTPLSDGATGEITLDTTGNEKNVTLVSKTFEPSSTTQTVTYTYTMSFPDTGVNQNASQGKTFEATLYADLGASDIYYNQANPNGTATKPTV